MSSRTAAVDVVSHLMKRILLIGESAALKSVLQGAASLQPVEIEHAAGGADALRKIRRRFFDVVVTDPLTPAEEDLALIGEMRRVRPGLLTILLAPVAAPEDVISAMREQVFACFSSPFEVSEVTAMIHRALEEDQWREGIEVLSAQRDWIELRVTCRLLNADRLVRFITELSSDLADEERNNLLTAFREILLNAMEYGAGFDPEKVVEVSAMRTERAIVYHFRDPGPGFRRDRLTHAALSNSPDDPLQHLRTREEQGLRPGGFGLLLTSQLVDELIYNEIGNEALLIKHTR